MDSFLELVCLLTNFSWQEGRISYGKAVQISRDDFDPSFRRLDLCVCVLVDGAGGVGRGRGYTAGG